VGVRVFTAETQRRGGKRRVPMRLRTESTLEIAEGVEILSSLRASAWVVTVLKKYLERIMPHYQNPLLGNRVSAPSAISGIALNLIGTLRFPPRLRVSAVKKTRVSAVKKHSE
jgi:hypothetical protein